jgi:hypothetical protein
MPVTATVSEIICCLIHELQVPLNTVRGSHDILSKESPTLFPEKMHAIGETSEQFWADVWDLRDHLAERIDLDSPNNAAAQMRQLASGWRAYEAVLSDAIDQIGNSGVVLSDPLLHNILNISFPGGLRGLKQGLAFLASIKPAQLTTRKTLSEMWKEE